MTDSSADDASREGNDERLQRRLKILRDLIAAGKIYINEGLEVIDSLKAVSLKADGTVDLSTVDGLVRSMALMAEFMHNREESKKEISLNEIQVLYFEFLERAFGPLYEAVRGRGLTPHEAGRALSESEGPRTELLSQLPEFLDTIKEFWRSVGDVARIHVEDMHRASKGVFGGDLFPAHSENIASKSGLYLDTIVLPDPFLRSQLLFDRWTDEKRAYFFAKHAFNLLQYKDLACAGLDPPIVVVVPDMAELEHQEKEFFLELGKRDALKHGARVFGREFGSTEEMIEFAQSLDTVERVAEAVKEPGRVLFDTEWTGSFVDKIARAAQSDHKQLLGITHPGVIVATQAIGRMATSNELLIKARRLDGVPMIDAPTSWQYFAWKLEYDATSAEKVLHEKNLHVVRGMQTLAQNEMQWLGKIPPAALIEVRKTGAIHEIREIIGKGVSDLASVSPDNFHRTTDQIFDNLNDAFDQHKAAVRALTEKKLKFAGSEIGSWIVMGSLEIAAAATGFPSWGLAALAAGQVLDAPKLKDIPASIQKLAKESAEVKRSPVGILFKLAERRRK